MIQEKLSEIIPFLEEQKRLLQKSMQTKQNTLLKAKADIEQTFAPVSSLQYTAEVQNERLDGQIEAFENMLKVLA